MNNEEDNDSYRNESAKVRTTLAALRTLEAFRRTKLAELRTGISVLAITLSILTILISTSGFWNPSSVIYLLGFVAVLIVILLIIGAYFFYQGLRGLRSIDRHREELINNSQSLDKMCDEIFDVK